MAKDQKKIEKKYEEYVKEKMPKPSYFKNCSWAFLSGGLLCTLSYYVQNRIIARGIKEETAATIILVGLICIAQLLTGLGVFDKLVKFAGAGLIVPITGFANSMVAPAMEYKSEGVVLGVGAKLFSLAGPVLVCGYSISAIVGFIYVLIG
ncbi:MAG: stage V sporulation protein AC [Peptostreptococcales bacterium]